MFYSPELLSIKSHSGLGLVWLVATLGPKSHSKKITKREYTTVDIVQTCKYVTAPPEPLSLRLASNLMIGVARIYGQQCQIYYNDTQAFYHRLSLLETGSKPQTDTNMKSTKAIKESITHDAAEVLSMNSELLLSGALEDLLMATPEAVRRLDSNVTPGVGRFTSLSLGRGNDSSSTVTAGLPFEPNDNYLNDLGLTDLVPMDGDFSFGDSGSGPSKGLGSFLHGIDGAIVPSGSGSLEVPLQPKKQRSKQPSKLRGLVFDEETTLDRGQLLFDKDEGLVPRLHHYLPLDWLDVSRYNSPTQTLSKEQGKRPSIAQSIEGPRRDSIQSGVFDYDPYYYDDGIPGVEYAAIGTPQTRSKLSLVGSESLVGGVGISDDSTSAASGVGFGLAMQGSSMGGAGSRQSTQGNTQANYALLSKLREMGSRAKLTELYDDVTARRRSVANIFLTVLTLTTSGQIRVQQERSYGPINILIN